jgi:SAM-dependent methyltransferase
VLIEFRALEENQYALLRAVEDDHWWYRGNRRLIQRLLARFGVLGPDTRGLDIGCGTGGNLAWLSQHGTWSGVDVHPAARAHALARDLDVYEGSAEALPFDDARFDVVTCFEVLYHREVADPAVALSEMARVTRPDGTLVLREPAYPILTGGHDAAVHGTRRFRRRPLSDTLRAAGWTPQICSYANALLFAPALAIRPFQGTEPHDDLGRGRSLGPLQSLLAAAIATEARALPWIRLPIGTSLLCIARRH